MDEQKAIQLESELKGRAIGKWTVQSLKNYGKSAAVFLATDGPLKVALKIFDRELIKRFGGDTQLSRIERELTLVGKSHPHMVEILGGGYDDDTDCYCIVMEFLDGQNIKQCLSAIPLANIPILIDQLADCAENLESLKLVHRDIKPENIILLGDFDSLKLLDFGVIRPVGEAGVTDVNGLQPFVGTLQYSSPEFLLRKEDDTTEGWRALTFYQIGGVLHDLIMRQPLFFESTEPFARLVNAVQMQVPQIQNSAVEPHLVELARSCLVKDPGVRLQLVHWD